MTKLTNLEIEEVSFVDAGANPEAHVTIFKRKEDTKMDEQKIAETTPVDKVDKAEEVTKVEEVTKTEEVTKAEVVTKPEVVAKADGFDELTATLKDLTDRLNAHIEKAEDAEFRKIAERYEILGTDAEKLAPMLKAASKSNPQLYETAIKVLDGALSAVEKAGTFEEIGKRGDGLKSEGQEQIQVYAAEIQKSKPHLTKRQAIDEAYLAHPELQ